MKDTSERIQHLLQQKQLIIEGLPHLYSFKFYKWAREFYESRNHVNLLCAANQISKMLCVNTVIPTPYGFKKMGELEIGDFIFGQDGKPTKVIDIPFIGEEDCYEFIFSDNTSIIAGKNHEWFAKGYKERFRKKYKSNWKGGNKKVFANLEYGKWNIYTTEEIINKGKYSPGTSPLNKFVIPVSRPVEFSTKEFLVPPYLLGILIGNGSLIKDVQVSLNAQDVDLEKYVCNLGAKKHNTGVDKVSVRFPREFHKNIVKLGMNVYSHEKEIPLKYLFGDEIQRKELLAGLLDTDGTVSKNGQNYSFCSTSYKLIEQVKFLVCSLGGICQIQNRGQGYYKNSLGEKILCKEFYVATIWTVFNPFKAKRKASRWKINNRYKHERVLEKIIPLGKRKAKCITVDNSDGSFLATENFIVTHNSSTQIRKCIHWATETSLWPSLWRNRPNMFWYLYPSKDVADMEWEKKWKAEFMPRDSFKNHPKYGWKEEKNDGYIYAIHFFSGVTVYFKTYQQHAQLLQAGSVDAVFCDEELPVDLFDELMFRLAAKDGYYHNVFTATIGQEFYRCALEEIGKKDETLKDAWKKQVSMYDCMYYEDGSNSPWTKQKIARIKSTCKSEAEVLRRVYGKFVKDENLRFPSFERGKNLVAPLWTMPPSDFHIYSGVDIGGGGESHPAAICFLAVAPDFKKGYIFRGWRGDKEITTTTDIYEKYKQIRGNLKPVLQTYDWQSKDFFVITSRVGESFTPADKTKIFGEDMINALFKSGMLYVFDIPELMPLVSEICSVPKEQSKSNAKDDYVDAMKFAVTRIPWNWDSIAVPEEEKVDEDFNKTEIDRRREGFFDNKKDEELWNVSREIEEWNELSENY